MGAADGTAFNDGSVRVLDHGYVMLVDDWGSDERIVEAARMTTGKGFLGWGPVRICKHCKRNAEELGPVGMWQHCSAVMDLHDWEEKPGDERLLRYLWKNKHHTPFEMAGATFEVQAPIMVFRQWFTHRTQSRNEHSARYGELPALDYLPEAARLAAEPAGNRQAAGVAPFDAEGAAAWLKLLADHYADAQDLYQLGLRYGVPKELARLPLTVARYSKMRVSANLRNWLHFLGLRCDTHAQWEIRQYADEIARQLAELFPRTLALWQEGR